MVHNVHVRDLHASLAQVGQLLDGLASEQDQLWPYEHWPAIHFDRPLSVGAVGRHGSMHDTVESYEPGKSICFRFIEPTGFEGTHSFTVSEVSPGLVRLQHVLSAHVKGRFMLPWLLIFRWWHDAVIEDLLDRAEAAVSSRPIPAPSWSPWVRLLRGMFASLIPVKRT